MWGKIFDFLKGLSSGKGVVQIGTGNSAPSITANGPNPVVIAPDGNVTYNNYLGNSAANQREVISIASELYQRFGELKIYIGKGIVFASEEVFRGTYRWGGASPRFPKFKNAAIPGLIDEAKSLGLPVEIVNRLRATAKKVDEQLSRVENADGVSSVKKFTSSENEREQLCDELEASARELETWLAR